MAKENLTVEEMKKAKHDFEYAVCQNINSLICDFEIKTGCSFKDITLLLYDVTELGRNQRFIVGNVDADIVL